jgi:iron complex transport system substrate-binding protein
MSARGCGCEGALAAAAMQRLIGFLAMLLLAAAAEARPARVVSINPCVDAVLLEVADAGQIAAISHYSQDPRATSVALAVARRFAATSGTAEEVVALRPDLVLAGAHVAPATVAALARLKVPVRTFGVPMSLAEARAQVRAIAGAVGQPARGAALVARIDAAVAAARRPGPPVSALIWQAGGLVPGEGTLADALMQAAGLRNASRDYGLKNWDVLPLEYLVADPPQLLLSDARGGAGDRTMRHPVLDRLGARMGRAPFEARLLSCAGPVIIPALARLSAARDGL